MERVWTTDLHRHAGERVRLAGWLHRLRRLSHVSFLVLRDGKGLAQVVAEEPALVERLAQLHHESVFLVEGLAVVEPQAPGGVEIHQPTVEVLSAAWRRQLGQYVGQRPRSACLESEAWDQDVSDG